MDFFAVDRRGEYIKAFTNGKGLELHTNGLSWHGAEYYRESLDIMTCEDDDVLIDHVLEKLRIEFYPEKPSRYKSVFAADNLVAAKRFREHYPGKIGPQGIFMLAPQGKVHKGDMNMLVFDPHNPASIQNLHLYWQGKTIQNNPFWEYVLELPVGIRIDVVT